MTEENEPKYELVMPFVAVKTAGGVYEDGAFVAGWECGHLDALMKSCSGMNTTFERYVNPNLLAQLDLIAMKHEFTMKVEDDYDPDEREPDWVLVTFRFGYQDETEVL